MAKIRYVFNHKTLTYEKLHLPFHRKVFELFWYLFVCLLFSGVVLIIGFNVIDSPKAKYLERQIAEIQLQYSMLDNRIAKSNDRLNVLESRDNNIYRPILNAGAIPLSIRQAGFGGVDRYKDLQGYANSDIMTETAKKMDILIREVYIQSKSYDEIEELAKNKTLMIACIPAIQPIDSEQLKFIGSGFGWRINPIYKAPEFHPGIDFVANEGTPIHATGDGVVERADNTEQGYGNHVVINHGFGYETLYGHMSRIAATVGEKVKRGEVIGYVGCTGLCTGDHVHYEVIKNGQKVNPIDYFFKDITDIEYKKIVKDASEQTQALD